jgi:hypothetical protein
MRGFYIEFWVSTTTSYSEKFKFNLRRRYLTFERSKVTKIFCWARGTPYTPAKRRHPCRHAVETPCRIQWLKIRKRLNLYSVYYSVMPHLTVKNINSFAWEDALYPRQTAISLSPCDS